MISKKMKILIIIIIITKIIIKIKIKIKIKVKIHKIITRLWKKQKFDLNPQLVFKI